MHATRPAATQPTAIAWEEMETSISTLVEDLVRFTGLLSSQRA